MDIVFCNIYGKVSDCEFSSIDKISSVDEIILTFLSHIAENSISYIALFACACVCQIIIETNCFLRTCVSVFSAFIKI